MMQGAQTCCPETTQRGGMGWKVGGRFKREWTYVYLWLIQDDIWQKPTQYCKPIILQLKQKKDASRNTQNNYFLFFHFLNNRENLLPKDT